MIFPLQKQTPRPFALHLVLTVLLICSLSPPLTWGQQALEQPSLVLLIIVDQLRGDFLEQYGDRLGSAGLGRIAKRGIHYTEAHFRHGITSTAPGHATIVTGAHPSSHGMVGNDWVDTATGQRVYCVEDKRHRLLGEPTRDRDGVSPANLVAETIGDVLIDSSGGSSRVFGISLKDRGAILTAGNGGKAFWFSRRTGRFVTSTYYYPKEPSWLTDFNAAKPTDAYRNRPWRLLRNVDDYRFADRDNQPWERDYKGLGRIFPHDLGKTTNDFYSAFRFTPYADELTLAAAAALMDAESIGKDRSTDLLTVSLSATDYIGHVFGPDSLEAEDNLFRLDNIVAKLLTLVESRVGLEHTLVVLTSDHGTPSVPEYLATRGKKALRIDTPKLIIRLNAALRMGLEITYDPVIRFFNPSLYLDVEKIRNNGHSVAEIERAIAGLAAAQSGIASAFPASELLADEPPKTAERELARAALAPTRFGLVYLVQEPGWHLHAKPEKFAAMHGSPHRYDTHVPIIVMGPGLDAQSVNRRVGMDDLAPSIATYLDLRPPAMAVGKPLPELFPTNGE